MGKISLITGVVGSTGFNLPKLLLKIIIQFIKLIIITLSNKKNLETFITNKNFFKIIKKFKIINSNFYNVGSQIIYND